jgi:hypothetical protein
MDPTDPDPEHGLKQILLFNLFLLVSKFFLLLDYVGLTDHVVDSLILILFDCL